MDAVPPLKAVPPAQGPKSARYLRARVPQLTPLAAREAEETTEEEKVEKAEKVVKTERWRETGLVRWPPISGGPDQRQAPDMVPVRQYSKHMQPWQGELWARSLRKPGLMLQHPIFAESTVGAKALHEEWGDVPPSSPRNWPYSGFTSARGSRRTPDAKDWIERPVSTGKYALHHMDGSRYKW
eukprot:CAMPEP_0181429192 /NCGR_PEP_ID=MMETSP1110-20121109/17071_1 /TAXON_ID=174948 /ORGANISM="Symbiodinium sp., Strain CCMP421" /LENGTH=182 /DNA_ID=CAMNT_0023552449 /DNA_START=57 /DNA_END=602 /DNA_ORIENTATION=-